VVPNPTEPETYAPPTIWSLCDLVPVSVPPPIRTEPLVNVEIPETFNCCDVKLVADVTPKVLIPETFNCCEVRLVVDVILKCWYQRYLMMFLLH